LFCLSGLQIGILPTDSYPAFVCDLADRAAVELLYRLKGVAASKRLSILCRDFTDVSRYTLGFPAPQPGQPDLFRVAKQILPGPYTLILNASKEIPKQITNFETGRSKRRSTVGVRMPSDPICQYVLSQLERPLLCTTARVEREEGSLESSVPDAAVFADIYGPQGLAFVVDAGPRVVAPSTVIDLSGAQATLVRQGKGDASWLVE
jgi:tRNA threonylcarbamoyl adenosine modification protein (Sua5/YciO/YrdC/YwlC family)